MLGALSPRTRNAQVALYQSGDVDFLVATDAIGMGLNLDVDHVAFSATRKFDGQNHRNLTPAELGQIAGRAGRHMNDGTFGVTGSRRAVRCRYRSSGSRRITSTACACCSGATAISISRTLERLHDSRCARCRASQRLTRARIGR